MVDVSKPYDIVVFGASGFAGKLVAEYLWSHYRGKQGAPRWAMAGRSLERLEAARSEIGAGQEIDLLKADAADGVSLAAIARSTRVVLATAGPFQTIGEPMLAACVEAGTDYADLCGEPLWMREMIDKYAARAAETGARICFSCGFDTLPFELGVSLLQQEAQTRFGHPLQRVRMRLLGARGAISAGTLASMVLTMQGAAAAPELGRALMDPFVLTPGFTGPEQPPALAPQFEGDLDSWTAPFFMAVINTKNIHRSNFLRGHPWGADFVYDEMVLTGPGPEGSGMASAIAAALQSADIPVPEGGGPNRAMRESGFYDLLFIGNDDREMKLVGIVRGRLDPGYGSTSRMLSETGMALLEHAGDAGVWTPLALLGDRLAARLHSSAEITFTILDGLPKGRPLGFEVLA